MLVRWLGVIGVVALAGCASGAAHKPPPTIGGTAPPHDGTVAPDEKTPKQDGGDDGTADPTVVQADADYLRGIDQIDADQPADAVKTLEGVLAAYEAKLDAEDEKIQNALFFLSKAYRNAEQWEPAEAMARRLLDLARRTKDRDDESTALNALGLIFDAKSDTAEARRAYQAAYDVEVAIGHDENVADTRIVMRNLASSCSDQQDYQSAADLLERVLSGVNATAPQTIEAAKTMYSLARAHHELDDQYDRTKQLYLDALAIQKVSLDRDDPAILETTEWLASLYWTHKDYEPARDQYKAVLEIRERGPRGDDLGGAYTDLGVVEDKLGDTATALMHFDQSLVVLRENKTPDNKQIIIVLQWVVDARLARKELVEADRAANEAVMLAAAVWGGASADAQGVVDELVNNYDDHKQAKRGKALRERAKKLLH